MKKTVTLVVLMMWSTSMWACTKQDGDKKRQSTATVERAVHKCPARVLIQEHQRDQAETKHRHNKDKNKKAKPY